MRGLPQKQNARRADKIRLCGHLGRYKKIVKKTYIICYNYYKSQRDTDFHFGDILGGMDNTRFIETKEEADEIIKNCISLINTEQ